MNQKVNPTDLPPEPAPDMNDRGFRDLLFSGVGFYRMSRRRRRQMWCLFGIALGVHVLGLLVFGGYVLMRERREEVVIFKPAPPLRTYEPRQLEHRVKVQQRQRSSSRPSMVPRVVAMRPSNLALPEIKADPRIINTTFQPKFKPVTGMGIGAGLGTGYGVGGFGEGVSNMDFFGIRARGERIVIILDASLSMAEESEELGVTEKGVAQYARVKARLGQVIDSLSPNSLFNLVVYAQTASLWRDEMQYVTEATRREAKQFMEPFNSQVSWEHVGHTSGISHLPHGLGNYASGGTTRFDLALSMAFKNRPDIVLVICDGDVWTTRAPSPEEMQAHQEKTDQWQRRHATARDSGEARTERVWVEGRPARAAAIRERGGHRAQEATEGRWEERTVHAGGRSLPPRPQLPQRVWNFNDYQNHIQALHEEFYEEEGRPMPAIHIIGFRSGRDDSAFLRRLARAFKGEFRFVRGM